MNASSSRYNVASDPRLVIWLWLSMVMYGQAANTVVSIELAWCYPLSPTGWSTSVPCVTQSSPSRVSSTATLTSTWPLRGCLCSSAPTAPCTLPRSNSCWTTSRWEFQLGLLVHKAIKRLHWQSQLGKKNNLFKADMIGLTFPPTDGWLPNSSSS